MLNTGDILPGGWEVETKLGEGSYGTVWRVRRELAGNTELAAVKHISVPRNEAELTAIREEQCLGDSAGVQAYLDDIRDGLVAEYSQMKQLQGHTNIVSCNDIQIIVKQDGPGYDVFIWMELLTSLSSRIIEETIDREEVLRIGMDICNALTLLADKGIVHRDIKPQNIFVNDHGDYKLGDFGTARNILGTSTLMSVKGTYAFMAPEIRLEKPADFTTDLYSLGLVLYRLMNNNKSPFMLPSQASTASSLDAANARRFSGEALPPPEHADAELAQIILKACAFEPHNRWQNAQNFHDALEELANGTVVRQSSDETAVTLPTEAVSPQDVPDKPADGNNSPEKPSLSAIWKYAIAAAVVLLLAAGGFLLGQKSKLLPADGSDVPPAIPAPTVQPELVQAGLPAQDYTISIYADNSCAITAYHGDKAKLKLPDTLLSSPVAGIGDYAFSGSTTLKKLTVPEGISWIGLQPFDRCSALETLQLPASVTSIGIAPLYGAENLRSVTVDSANPCYHVTDNLLLSHDGRLLGCPAASGAAQCIVPEDVKTIGACALAVPTLTSVTLPEGLEAVERLAFSDSRLTSLHIPASVSYLEPGAFTGASSLCELTVAHGNPLYYASNNVLFNRNGMLICYPAGLTASRYEIPSGITSIANYAFAGSSLTEIVIPQSVQSIGSDTFYDLPDAVLLVSEGSCAHQWAIDNNQAYTLID